MGLNKMDKLYSILVESLKILEESGHQNAIMNNICDEETISNLKKDNYTVVIEKGKTFIYWKA